MNRRILADSSVNLEISKTVLINFKNLKYHKDQ